MDTAKWWISLGGYFFCSFFVHSADFCPGTIRGVDWYVPSERGRNMKLTKLEAIDSIKYEAEKPTEASIKMSTIIW